eukprot:8123224-Pyramimonas_sp.AAC.1
MAGWSAAVFDPAVRAAACPSGSELAHASMVATEKKNNFASPGGPVNHRNAVLHGGDKGLRRILVESVTSGALVQSGDWGE